MARIIATIETIAALLLAAVALLITAGVVLRYGFSVNLPDAFDLSRFLQGVALFWGLAITTYAGSHICVDIAHEMVGPGGKRLIDIAAESVMAAAFAVFAYAMHDRLWPAVQSGQTTNELLIPTWPFFLIALAGVAVTAFIALMRLIRAVRGGEQGLG
jgi:TRAP-type C4-dicarboxylate transport system permease small subunit